MINNKAAHQALAILSVLVAACASQNTPIHSSSDKLASSPVDTSRALGVGDTPEYIAFTSNEFGIGLVPDGNEVRINAFEMNPKTGVFYKWNAAAQTSYEVLAVCSRHANEHYVYGEQADGTAVLERWDLTPWVNGAYYTQRKSSATPIGMSIAPSVTTVRYKGSFVVPDLRTTPALTRTGLTAPTGIGDVAEIEVDPEGRYLVLRTVELNGASTLEQLNLSTGFVVTLASPTTEPNLAVAEEFCFTDSTELGRMLVVFTDNLQRLFLNDKDNDGVFESSFNLQRGEELYNALPPFTLTQYP